MNHENIGKADKNNHEEKTLAQRYEFTSDNFSSEHKKLYMLKWEIAMMSAELNGTKGVEMIDKPILKEGDSEKEIIEKIKIRLEKILKVLDEIK